MATFSDFAESADTGLTLEQASLDQDLSEFSDLGLTLELDLIAFWITSTDSLSVNGTDSPSSLGKTLIGSDAVAGHFTDVASTPAFGVPASESLKVGLTDAIQRQGLQ